MTLDDRSVMGIVAFVREGLERHHMAAGGRCVDDACHECAAMYQALDLAATALPDAAQTIADLRATILARTGGGTDRHALRGTVFAR